jgi:hypothetical protein
MFMRSSKRLIGQRKYCKFDGAKVNHAGLAPLVKFVAHIMMEV